MQHLLIESLKCGPQGVPWCGVAVLRGGGGGAGCGRGSAARLAHWSAPPQRWTVSMHYHHPTSPPPPPAVRWVLGSRSAGAVGRCST
eukprot:scaffold11666_cov199-Ochromonas_danica.AAC.5